MANWFDAHLLDILNGFAGGALLFMVSAGLSLLFGVFRVLNLAHGALFLVGGSIAWKLTESGATWPRFLVALALAAAVGAIAGLALGVLTEPLARRSHLDQALLTVGLALVLVEGTTAVFGSAERQVAFPPPLQDSVDLLGHEYPLFRLVIVVVGTLLAMVMHVVLERTHAGALVRATAADRDIVDALGFDTRRVMLAVFAIAAALASVAGVLGGRLYGASPGVDRTVVLLALVVVVVGGLGSVKGTFVAAMLIGQVESLGVALLPDQASVLLFVAMAVVLAARPNGLLGERAGAG